MKNLLILAYDFPPYVSVGALRPYSWYKYLNEFGVYPIVITRQWKNQHGNELDYISESESKETIIEKNEFGTIIRTPYFPNLANRIMLKHGDSKYKLLRRCISAFFELIQFIFFVGPKSEMYYSAKKYLKLNNVDAIIATGDPFVLFSYASKLSKEFGVPWIADYRDPWLHNEEHQKNRFQQAWNSYLEKKIVSTASHVCTVSTFVHSKIELLIPNKPFSILPNGYDPMVIDEIRNIPQNSKELCIAFVGTIYNWHPIESFLRVANEFILNHSESKIKFKFYGTNITDDLKKMIQDQFSELRKYVVISPKIPNNELLEKLASDNVMLLFNYYSYMGTKIFDYIGIKRKIMLCYTNDPEANELKRKDYAINESEFENKQLQADLINETNSGIIVKDAAHLQQVLQELYAEFEENGFIACNSVGVEKYSRKIQVERLSELVKEIGA